MKRKAIAVLAGLVTAAWVIWIIVLLTSCNQPSSCRDACGCGSYPKKCTMWTTECEPNPVLLLPSSSAVVDPGAPGGR